MGKDGIGQCVFPLTSLQIGDLQSYLSDLSLFLGPESDKFYILVDNRPWLKDLGLRSAHLWQLMVTKSRLSPFANTKAKRGRKYNKMIELRTSSTSRSNKRETLKRWFSLINAATVSQKRVLLPVKNLRRTLLLNSELHRTLYGFIVFEVAWTNVRGLNYLNELQTDTSLAVEAMLMRRWEFDSIAQASSCLSAWFSGTHYEQTLLRDYLQSVAGEVFYDAEDNIRWYDSVDEDPNGSFSRISMSEEDRSPDCYPVKYNVDFPTVESGTDSYQTPPHTTGPYKRRKVARVHFDQYFDETHDSYVDSEENFEKLCMSDCELEVEPTEYEDVLILFRFKDPDLPFKLREIIMSDLRLLRLLEYGLPSWVLFLQSYPVFCHLYRPWMCPLARALYVAISVVTVLIGFYDLYKNVPVLKATAYRLCGPLLDWIETWEMVSRIKYLGTMLFLHNFQKAVQWFFMMSRTTRSFLSVLAQPLAGPLLELLKFLLPLWNMCIGVTGSLFSFISVAIGSSSNLLGNLIEILVWPLWFISCFIWSVATSVICPMFWILWEILYAPIRFVLVSLNVMASTYGYMSVFLGNIWRSISSIFQFASASEVAVSRYEVSMWRSLWSDLFSQVFRAIRSILNGFVAFFTACNRHRLSIYNHILEFIRRLFGQRSPSDPKDSRQTCRAQTLSEARR